MGEALPDKILKDPGPNLCFRKDEFMRSNFCVDTFVSEHRKHAGLEKLRDDLGVHLKFLKSSMIELINKDYADFVNLSANLVGLDKFIRNISKPLEELRDQVTDVKAEVETSLNRARTELEARRGIQEKKALLQQAVAVCKSVEKIERLMPSAQQGNRSGRNFSFHRWTNEQVEQVAMEVNQVLFYLSKCKHLKLAGAVTQRVDAVTWQLQRHLEETFLSSLRRDSRGELGAVLRICATLDRVGPMEELFRKKVVAPALDEMVQERVLQEVGLEGIYDQVVMFASTRCQTLLDLTSCGSSMSAECPGYAFVGRGLWPELCEQLERRLPSVFAAGNPGVFQSRFSATLAFLARLERLCGSIEAVGQFRQQESYRRFLAKWNLAIYFQLRFQEIASQLEVALSEPGKLSSEGPFRLSCHQCLWAQLERCWHPEVFVTPLAHRFWKLTLQLLARHRHWLHQQAQGEDRTRRRSIRVAEDALVSRSQQEHTVTHKNSTVAANVFVAMILTLFGALSGCAPLQLDRLLEDTVRPQLEQAGFTDIALLKGALEECRHSLEGTCPTLSGRLVENVAAACCLHLKAVADIPRLYRRTNREVPSKPSNYVAQVLVPLATLKSKTTQDFGVAWQPEWTGAALEQVTKQYTLLTQEVLVSVRKMEDSLKRLKRARDRTPVPEGAASDDDKIRLQLCLDVQHFGAQMEELDTARSSVPSYGALLEIVEAARTSPSS
ncbi:conserved oligomeric golgi complex subunit, putative [Ixodes scapularis]|uniref:Conserved oligomeric Golgi complex subunit 2 n=1 Tax=Ixodes scapularis TaxID=6945 RepID=B7PSB3_IXOSC|nr:conserved oligomeric golgi complex subunit, putative [Ixodes scapularis]|eukprot:XP_002402131.1 conserved oligomeric golgi complex subunit, putative [Ixodes scapularis]